MKTASGEFLFGVVFDNTCMGIFPDFKSAMESIKASATSMGGKLVINRQGKTWGMVGAINVPNANAGIVLVSVTACRFPCRAGTLVK